MNLLRRLLWWFRRDALQAELAEEMAAHEEMKERELLARGVPAAEVAAARRRAMGNATLMREDARGVWIWPWLDRLGQDVRYALRSIRKQPTFSFGVLLLTSLGIGATTTIFSVVDGVVLRPLPYPAADRLIVFDWGAHSPPRFRDWQRTIGSVEQWAGVWTDQADLVGDGPPQRLDVARVSPDFLAVFGARTILGRTFSAADFVEPAPVVALAEDLWRTRFGADSAIVGRTINLGGRPVVVVGVVGRFPVPEELVARTTAIWTPLTYPAVLADNPNYQILSVAARLKPGVSMAAARDELRALAPRLAAESPRVHGGRNNEPFPIPILPLQAATVARVRTALLLLFGAVGLMLLIACANVINLYLARSADRAREMGVRAALGAGRLRLARQLVTESVTLGLVAGVLGAALAALGVKVLAAWFPGDLPRATEVTVDGRVLAFALAVSLLTAVAFGLAPALALREGRTVEAIKSGGAADRGGRSRFRSGLVVAEIALALVLLVGAGLLFRSFVRMIRVDPGFDPGGLVVARLELRRPFTSDSATRARDAEWRAGFSRAVTERIRGLPGVVSASAGVVAPMVRTGTGRCCWGADVFRTEDSTEVRGRIMIHPIGPGYFATIGARLRGREFAAERQAAPYPAILSDALAARLFGGADPIGRKLAIDDAGFVVSGVVSGLHQWGLDQSGDLEVFVPYDPLGIDFNMLDLTVRGSVPAAALVPAIRQAIWDLEPTLPADDVVPMDQLIRRSLAAPRFIGTLMGIFGGLALLLAAAGVYASMLYAVRQRNREMGIRVAMGADAPAITRMVVGDAGRLALLGLLLGTAGGAGLARLLTSFLFEVEPGDPIAFAAGAALLGGAVLLAAWLPARRAGRADPLAVLRSD